ncbi:MAG: flagellar basal body rod C-terminal domain-containing protein [Desulfomicrobium sp.]
MMENVQAMQAISFSQQVAANNVANMNTNGFHSSRVELETGPDGRGVQVQDVYENTAAGPLVPGGEYVETDEGLRYEEMLVEGSNTDLATEMVRMIENEHAFAANAAALHTSLDMTGVIINMMV